MENNKPPLINPINSPLSSNTTSPIQPIQTKKSQLPIIFLSVLSLLFLFGLVYFYLQTQSLKQQLVEKLSPTPLSTISPNPTPSITSTTNSHLFQIKDLNLSFQLPTKLTKLGSWETTVLSGDTGNNICFHLLPNTSWLIHSVKAGGVGICSGKYLTINSVSSDFTAARGGSFTDVSGYQIKNNEYFLGLNNSEGERPLTTNQPKEITTNNGLKYLLIMGESIDNPGQLLPSEYIGALINTGDQKYPGIVIAMQLSDLLNLNDFTQILSTFELKK